MLFFALCDRYPVVKIQSGADCHGAFPNKLVAPERERAEHQRARSWRSHEQVERRDAGEDSRLPGTGADYFVSV